jgi:hypothetical protein
VTTTDADPGDTVTLAYTWTVNSAVVGGATGATLSGVSLTKGDTVSCSATPSDGTATGSKATAATLTIQNSAPVLASATLAPATAYEDSELTCTPGSASDADGDTVTFVYAWFVNGGQVTGETTDTLTGASFAHGDSVYCTITPKDSGTAGTPAQSNAITIQDSAPTLSAVVLSPASPVKASTLTCTPSGFFDADNDTPVYSYAWKVDNAAVSGQTGSTLSGAFSKGQSVVCVVTPGDGTTFGSPVTSNAVVVGNTAPVASSVTITPSSPIVGDPLTASVSATDADNDSITYTYSWTKDGAGTGYTGNTVPSGVTALGEVWAVTATPSDGTATGAPVTASVTIASDPNADDDGDLFTVGQGDCDDTDPAINPDAAEAIDGVDNDCNSTIDDRWVTVYTYGSGLDTYGTIASDTSIRVEDNGAVHLFFSGLDGSSAGGDLFTQFNTTSMSMNTPTKIDALTAPRLNQTSIWQRSGYAESRVLFWDAGTTGTPIKFQSFTTPSSSGAFQTVVNGTSSNPVTTDSLALVTDQSNGNDYIAYTYTNGAKGACTTTGQIESKLFVVPHTAGASTFGTLPNGNPVTSSVCSSAGLALNNVSMTFAASDSVLHTSWYNASASSTGLNYRHLLLTSGSPSKVVLGLGAGVGYYNAIASPPATGASYPVIAYFDPNANEIRTVTGNTAGTSFGSPVTPTTVVDSALLGGVTPAAGRIVFRYHTDGTAHLLFQAASNLQLWYATDASGSWVAERVLTSASSISGQNYDMVIDADGNPRISFRENTNADLYSIKGKRFVHNLLY